MREVHRLTHGDESGIRCELHLDEARNERQRWRPTLQFVESQTGDIDCSDAGCSLSVDGTARANRNGHREIHRDALGCAAVDSPDPSEIVADARRRRQDPGASRFTNPGMRVAVQNADDGASIYTRDSGDPSLIRSSREVCAHVFDRRPLGLLRQ